ncbi:MAG: hypothetical protein BJ554DRAFT_7576 [Olpidium bornovanus]|uniref:Uncharacterized protein n=1 Tax=Olpidium bornovanus TaxID=278681 RepID=A0A8H8DM59_9FUNG|nr:MAG: hypothetical protein BJ554DRAFT_7576 [Olpidium bornovanus]
MLAIQLATWADKEPVAPSSLAVRYQARAPNLKTIAGCATAWTLSAAAYTAAGVVRTCQALAPNGSFDAAGCNASLTEHYGRSLFDVAFPAALLFAIALVLVRGHPSGFCRVATFHQRAAALIVTPVFPTDCATTAATATGGERERAGAELIALHWYGGKHIAEEGFDVFGRAGSPLKYMERPVSPFSLLARAYSPGCLRRERSPDERKRERRPPAADT